MTRDTIDYGEEALFSQKGFRVRAFVSPHNERIRVIESHVADVAAMKATLVQHATTHGLGKIFFKLPISQEEPFLEAGFEKEAAIGGFFDGEDAAVLSLFTEAARSEPRSSADTFVSMAQLPSKTEPVKLPDDMECRIATAEDAEVMSALLGNTFASYPFPVTDPDFLRHSMAAGNIYRLIERVDTEHRRKVVAMASAEIDFSRRNAELTDFATAPSCQRMGLGRYLRETLEKDMRQARIGNLYTLARAVSIGMNRVFAAGGYHFGGILKQNCSICGSFEDMTCWWKKD